eukprot:6515501-Pyramimonas_sp.AAC.1
MLERLLVGPGDPFQDHHHHQQHHHHHHYQQIVVTDVTCALMLVFVMPDCWHFKFASLNSLTPVCWSTGPECGLKRCPQKTKGTEDGTRGPPRRHHKVPNRRTQTDKAPRWLHKFPRQRHKAPQGSQGSHGGVEGVYARLRERRQRPTLKIPRRSSKGLPQTRN